LDNDPWVYEVGLTVWAMAARDVDDAIDAFRGRRGAVRRRVTFASARLLPAQLGVLAAKGSGLPMRFSPSLIELFTEAAVLGFELGEAALQLGNLALETSNGAVSFATAGACGEYHDNPPLSIPEERDDIKVRCRGVFSWYDRSQGSGSNVSPRDGKQEP